MSSLMKVVNNIPGLVSEKTTMLTAADVDAILSKADVDGNKKLSRQGLLTCVCMADFQCDYHYYYVCACIQKRTHSHAWLSVSNI